MRSIWRNSWKRLEPSAKVKYLKIVAYTNYRAEGMLGMENLTNLEYLELDRIGLTGEIPELGRLANLKTPLILSNNKFTGSIPASFSQL
jgi:hypothetical protein